MYNNYILIVTFQLLFWFSCSAGSNPVDCSPGVKTWNDNGGAAFYTQEICNDLYAYGDGAYIGMFAVSNEGVIFVDAPSSMAWSIGAVAASVTDEPITTVIYSHHHGDHIGAVSQLPGIEKAAIWCHYKTYKQLQARPDLNVPLCTRIITKTPQEIKVGNQKFIIEHADYRWHTDNDLFILAPKQRTIMAVDLVYPGWIPFKNIGMATDPDKYREAHNFLLSMSSVKHGDWENYIGGHVDRIGTREDVKESEQYYDELNEAAHTAQGSVSWTQVVKDNGGFNGDNTWKIVKDYQNQIAQKCADIMIDEKKWDKKIKGTDSYMVDNCFWAYENIHINIA